MGGNGFKDLAVWQRAKDLAVSIYKVSSSEMKSVDLGLKDQLRRSAVSVASNLAEETNVARIGNRSAIFSLPRDLWLNYVLSFRSRTNQAI